MSARSTNKSKTKIKACLHHRIHQWLHHKLWRCNCHFRQSKSSGRYWISKWRWCISSKICRYSPHRCWASKSQWILNIFRTWTNSTWWVQTKNKRLSNNNLNPNPNIDKNLPSQYQVKTLKTISKTNGLKISLRLKNSNRIAHLLIKYSSNSSSNNSITSITSNSSLKFTHRLIITWCKGSFIPNNSKLKWLINHYPKK